MAAGSRRRARLLWAGGALVAVLLSLWLWPATPSSAPIPAPPAGGATVASRPPAPAAPPAVVGAALPGPLSPPPAPIIDEVVVEKPEVCEGEENLVSVRAHTVDGTDEHLHFLVGGVPGRSVPVRVFGDDDASDQPPPLEVVVFGKNNVRATAPVPSFVVKPCKPERTLTVTARLRANTWGEFDLEAKVSSSGKPFQPRRFEWSFGDGERATTAVPHVVHSFEGRDQKTQYSQLLVSVKAFSHEGESVLGRVALQLANPVYADLHDKGVVSLLVTLTPRFPQVDSDGVVRQRVRLSHLRDRPVFLHSMLVFHHGSDGAQRAPEIVDPARILGTSIIPPGKGIEVEVQLRPEDPFSIEHYLEGKDSDGLPVRGAFSVMRPPERPTKENSQPVTDPELKSRILAARELLGTPYVTDEDLWRLEREGKLQARAAQPRPAPPEKPPAEQPPDPPPGPTSPNGSGDRLRTPR